MDTSPRVVKSDVHPRLMGEVEKILLAAALKKTGYVQTDAARFLGINRNTLAKKIRQYGLKSEQE
jgi:DNA-binding protein Fis